MATVANLENLATSESLVPESESRHEVQARSGPLATIVAGQCDPAGLPLQFHDTSGVRVFGQRVEAA